MNKSPINPRYALESVRAEIRVLKWHCAENTPLDRGRLTEKLGALADYVSEHLDHIDDGILLRSSLPEDNYIEVRVGNKKALAVEDIDFLQSMLALTRAAVERSRRATLTPPAGAGDDGESESA